MFGNNFTLFHFLGFRVRANVSWLFLAILVTWSLAVGLFPAQFPGLDTATYWALGFVGMVGLFFSLLFHEFAHSVVARANGLPVRGITLFLFGGVSEMEMEPNNARTEFWVAIVGPLASVVLAVLFFGLNAALNALDIPPHLAAVTWYLAFINVLLAVFNMVPGFPLDGGRVLRALLWYVKGDLHWATRWATRMGQGFGLLLATLGVFSFFAGNFVGGIWWVLIGLFLYGAAGAAYQRLVIQEALKGRRVRHIMTADPVTVPPHIPVREFIDNYLYKYGYDMFPVVSDGRLSGCITLRHVRDIPKEQWDHATVRTAAGSCSEENTIKADANADEALSLMQRTGNGRLIVMENGRLVGILVMKDLLNRLSLREQLEGVQ